MKRFYVLSLITFFIFIFTGKAPESQDIPNKITVGVAVDCKDKSAKNLIENNIKKELRQLRDVVIIDPEKKSL